MLKAVRRRAVVVGRVQGVGFRWYTRERAVALGLTGWVRNLPDGSVEVWFQGEPGAAAEMEGWLQRGAPAARVREARISDEPPLDCEIAFEIR
jgi:acylphosphatase